MFEELKDIQPARKTTIRQKQTLDTLIEFAYKIVEKHVSFEAEKESAIFNSSKSSRITSWMKFEYKNYKKIYALSQQLPDLKAEDILALFHALNDYSLSISTSANNLFSVYVSTLVHVLTERNQLQNKRSIFYFSGMKGTHTLLDCLHTADVVVIDGYNHETETYGGVILNNAAFFKGNINTIILRNVRADLIADYATSFSGNIGLVLLQNVIASNCLADSAIKGGRIGAVVANNVVAIEGYFGLPTENSKPKRVQYSNVGLYVQKCFSGLGEFDFYTDKAAVQFAPEHIFVPRTRKLSHIAKMDYARFDRKYHLKQLFELVDRMTPNNISDVLAITDRIAADYRLPTVK